MVESPDVQTEKTNQTQYWIRRHYLSDYLRSSPAFKLARQFFSEGFYSSCRKLPPPPSLSKELPVSKHIGHARVNILQGPSRCES